MPKNTPAPASMLMPLRKSLGTVLVPGSTRSIIAAGRVEGLTLDKNGTARAIVQVGPSSGDQSALDAADITALLEAAKSALLAVAGVKDAVVIATEHQNAKAGNAPSPERASATTGGFASGHDNPLGLPRQAPSKPGGNTAPAMPGAGARKRARAEQTRSALSQVGNIIAVASGKGGVGKSTVTLHLAQALAAAGNRVGILDADIYGPSLPALTGIMTKADTKDGKITPVQIPVAGPATSDVAIFAMSMGWLVDEAQALAWRGPMVMGAVRQLINDVDWPPLDILLIDTPPGTGDAHLTLIQSGVLHGAIIVSTPQTLALADVRRGLALFAKTNVPILGLVENMAWLEAHDGTKTHPFGEPKGPTITRDLNVPLLATLPLDPDIQSTDQPVNPSLFEALAHEVLGSLRRA